MACFLKINKVTEEKEKASQPPKMQNQVREQHRELEVRECRRIVRWIVW